MKTLIRIKELREEAGVTQKQIAEILHINQNTYSQYENGKRQIPLDALLLLAGYYGVSIDYILDLTDVDMPYPRK